MYTLGSLRKAVFDGDTKNGSLMAGQISCIVNEERTVKEVLDDMMNSYEELRKNL